MSLGFSSLQRDNSRSNNAQFAALLHTISPGFLAIVVLLLAWEVGSQTGVINPHFFPSMSATFLELARLMQTGDFWKALFDTLRGWAAGLAIAAALAIPLGIVLGWSEVLYRAFRIPIEFMRPIPSVSLVPVALLIFGVGIESKTFLAAFAAFWPLLVQTIYGVKDTNPVALDTARCFGLSSLQRMIHVMLPSALPYIVTGIRISSSVSLILAVTAEVVIGAPGLGREINVARSSGDTTGMYAFIIAIGLTGWLLNTLTIWFERRALHWHASQRRGEA
ncbi:ABC transporter permease [Mesorhizobium sp. SP-1A]|uniref:ABC transporter permease n=1 Tax=Mesorhizobium sp. SP-1A TaxID=3077840 RepID=UPI0028F72836|nr:ABC transporter permease [Mesorhizobium sp. SP-1A]